MTLEKQLGSILKKLKNTVANIIEIENTVNSRAESVNATNEDVQAKAEEMKKYVDTMNSSINTLNTLETQISDLKTSVSSTTDRAEKMLKETQAIRDTLTDALVWKGSVENYAALPTTNVRVGDTYNVTAADSAHNINAGDNVVWDGTKWDSMGGIMNVDSLAVKGQDASFKEVTATTFHGTLNGKADSATTADVAKTVAWDNVGGKPATFPSDIKFDDVPTAGSLNAVKSSGIKSALDQKLSTFGGTLTGDITLSGDAAIVGKGGALVNSSETAIGLAAINTVDFYGKKGLSIERTSYIDTTNGKYHGDVIGTADRATVATNDSSGANIASTYIKKTGDTATGKITFASTDLNALPEVKKTSDDNMSGIRFSSKSKFLGAVGKRLSNGEDLLNLRSDNSTTDVVLDSRNYGSYALPKSGGSMSGPLNFANGTWNLVGDDSYMGDRNISGTFCVKGANGETGIALVNKGNENDYARISYGGGNINFSKTIGGNITGNSGTATKLQTPRNISLTGDASGSATFDGSGNISINTTVSNSAAADKVNNSGNRKNLASGQKPDVGLQVFQCYTHAEYPQKYGNVLSIGGLGDNELFLGWQDDMRPYYRSKRDTSNDWTDWKALAYISDINHYAPTKTGGGASGTWGISISGTATKVYGMYTGNGGQQGPGYFGTNSAGCLMSNQSVNGHTEFKNWLYMDNYKGTDVGGATAIGVSREETRAYIMSSNADRKQWDRTAELLSSANYNSFAPTKTGGGASGTWGINITGNAKTATTASSVAWSGVTGKPGTYPPSAHNHDSAYPSVTGTRASGTWGINISGNAASADKVDGYHESSFLRYRGDAAANGEDTYWNQIGIKRYDGKLPQGISGTYNYGGVVSLPAGAGARLDIWYNHHCSTNGDGLWYRSGYSTDKKAWARLLDSVNYTKYAPTKTGSGASGTWPISISGSAASASSVAWGNVTGKPSTFAPASHSHSWDATTGKPSGIVKVASWDGSTLSLTTAT